MNMQFALNNRTSNPYAALMNRRQSESSLQKSNDVRTKLRLLATDRKSVYDGFSKSSRGNLLINATIDYGKTIKAQRQQQKDALLSIKTVKYQFKNISSQIIRAKTSSAARQAVGQAEREVMRLKREKNKEGVDETEINAAITHAKAMERIAKRKVKHLEQEEMAKASMGSCVVCDEKEVKDEQNVDETEDKAEGDFAEGDTEDTQEMSSEDFERMVAQMGEMTEEMMQAVEEGMEDLLSELNDELSADVYDMEPEDLKMLKIKHRNREMKDIVKADSDYLKVIFDRLEQMKDGGAPLSGNVSSGDSIVPTADFGGQISGAVIDVAI